MARPSSTMVPPSAASRGTPAVPSPSPIQTLEAADLALFELARLNAFEKRLSAECDAELARIRDKFGLLMVWRSGDKEVPIADRRAELEAQIEEFATRNRKHICGSEKSRELKHGRFGWHLGNWHFEDLKTGPSKQFTKALEAVKKLLRQTLSKSFRLFGGAGGDADILRLKIELDKRALLDKLQKNEIKPNAVKRFGLKYVRGESFWIEPKAEDIASQSDASPAPAPAPAPEKSPEA